MADERALDHIVVATRDLDAAARRYEALGFTLTPRARHPDHMGTSNRLAQFADRNFIELVEVDRPQLLDDHDFAASPPRFTFGAHNRAFLERAEGMSMLVLTSDDAHGDAERFAAAGLGTYAPFDFHRRATLPDGSQVEVSFSLAFATSPAMPEIAFFVCQNRFPQHFWKPAFQAHANGARGIATVYIAADDPDAHVGFLAAFSGGTARAVDGGHAVSCGRQEIRVLTPDRIAAIAPGFRREPSRGPGFAGIAIAADGATPRVTPAEEACGLFIDWRRT